MRRILSLTLVLGLAAMMVMSVGCAAAGSAEATPDPVSQFDPNFDIDLATTLIVVICSVLTAVILVLAIVLAKRNIHN